MMERRGRPERIRAGGRAAPETAEGDAAARGAKRGRAATDAAARGAKRGRAATEAAARRAERDWADAVAAARTRAFAAAKAEAVAATRAEAGRRARARRMALRRFHRERVEARAEREKAEADGAAMAEDDTAFGSRADAAARRVEQVIALACAAARSATKARAEAGRRARAHRVAERRRPHRERVEREKCDDTGPLPRKNKKTKGAVRKEKSSSTHRE